MKICKPFNRTYPITQAFVERFTDQSGHKGIDYALPLGTPVLAAADGCVSLTETSNEGYGSHIVMVHGDGIETLYAHLSVPEVTTGQAVQQGEEIGLSGNSGNSTGPHLHFELRLHNKAVDPAPYFSQDPQAKWQVICDVLNVRSGPGIHYPVCGYLNLQNSVVALTQAESLWIEISPGKWAAAIFEGQQLMENMNLLNEPDCP